MSKTRLSKVIQSIFYRMMEARIDIKNKGENGNDLSLIYISDSRCVISKPAWFSRGGIGYSLRSVAGNIRLTLTFVKSGIFNIFLHTEPCSLNDENKIKIPVWIDYDYLSINDKDIFREKKETWHDEWFAYERAVKDGEEMTIEVGWSPHLHEEKSYEQMISQLLERSFSKILPPPGDIWVL